jgi:hypothetical protein
MNKTWFHAGGLEIPWIPEKMPRVDRLRDHSKSRPFRTLPCIPTYRMVWDYWLCLKYPMFVVVLHGMTMIRDNCPMSPGAEERSMIQRPNCLIVLTSIGELKAIVQLCGSISR